MKLINFFKWIGIYCCYYISFLIPRNKNLWLYSSLAGKFVDNAKYFFLYANKTCTDIRHVWLTDNDEVVTYLRSKGFESYNKRSFKAILLSLRAKVLVYSAYSVDISNPAYIGGAFRFNLWHGIPLKKIEYDISKGPLTYLFHPKNLKEKLKRFIFSPPLTKKHDAVLATSEKLRKIFSDAFRVSNENILVAQYPRLMPFFWTKEEILQHIQKIEPNQMQTLPAYFLNFRQVWVYMPTWRDADSSFISKALPDLKLLNDTCKGKEILFILKTHINTVFSSDVSQFSNLILLDRNADVYPLLPLTHTLVTDYSSIFFDYALLKKPVLFYPYDINEYINSSREFYFDYNNIVQGMPVANSFGELINHIQHSEELLSTCVENSFESLINRKEDFAAPVLFIKNKIGLSN